MGLEFPSCFVLSLCRLKRSIQAILKANIEDYLRMRERGLIQEGLHPLRDLKRSEQFAQVMYDIVQCKFFCFPSSVSTIISVI